MPTTSGAKQSRPVLVRVIGSDFDMRKRRWYLREPFETGRAGVMELRRKAEPVSPGEVQEVFGRDRTLAGVMKHYGLEPRKALKVLELYGIPFRALLKQEFEAGATLAILRERHSIGETTLSRWLRDAGAKVRSGRKIPAMPADQVRKLWADKMSINHVAKAFDVHWKTAQKRLQELGLS